MRSDVTRKAEMHCSVCKQTRRLPGPDHDGLSCSGARGEMCAAGRDLRPVSGSAGRNAVSQRLAEQRSEGCERPVELPSRSVGQPEPRIRGAVVQQTVGGGDVTSDAVTHSGATKLNNCFQQELFCQHNNTERNVQFDVFREPFELHVNVFPHMSFNSTV